MTIRDRTEQLKAAQKGNDVCVSVNHESHDDVPPFMVEVQEISKVIDKLNVDIGEMEKVHSQIISSPEHEKGLKLRLETLMANIKKSASRVRLQIKSIELSMENVEPWKRFGVEYRIKETQHTMLKVKIVDVMNNYNDLQNKYREKCKERIQRQLELTGRMKTVEEVEEMLEQGDLNVFTQGILTDTHEARKTLQDIKDRHADIMKLEKSIRELHELFTDMALLIECQGDMINRIENHVGKARDYVQNAAPKVIRAESYKRKSRKMTYILVGVVIVVVIAISVIIIF